MPNARRRWRCWSAVSADRPRWAPTVATTPATSSGTRALGVTPHVAQNDRGRRSAIDRRTTRHDGYRQSQRRRKRVEAVFGWIKTIGGGSKLRYLGRARNKLWLELTAAAYDLTRIAQLEAAAA